MKSAAPMAIKKARRGPNNKSDEDNGIHKFDGWPSAVVAVVKVGLWVQGARGRAPCWHEIREPAST